MSAAENVVTVVWDTWLKPGAETEGFASHVKCGPTCEASTAMSRIKFSSIRMLQDTLSLSWGGARAPRTGE